MTSKKLMQRTLLITKALLDHGLDIYDCIAQCYDGASVMSGEHSGVQRRIRNVVEHYICTLPCSQAESSSGFYCKTYQIM